MKLTMISPALPLQQLPTLFARFMAGKLNAYVEPAKKGTPKGDPVGFSLAKYKATLFALRERVLPDTADLVTQAKELGVSYGVLRKWRSEQKFKELVSQHEREFVSRVLGSSVLRGVVLKGTTHNSLAARLGVLKGANVAGTASEPSKEALRKLMILIHGNVQSALVKSDVSPKTLKEYQLLALNHAIELLKDRRATPKHRKAIINLLSGIKETLE
jgi:hypothetical protein